MLLNLKEYFVVEKVTCEAVSATKTISVLDISQILQILNSICVELFL